MYVYDNQGRNVVKIVKDDKPAWVLVDLDASVKKGAAAAEKVTSTMNFPPELARRELQQPKSAGAEIVIANEQFEMWYEPMRASCCLTAAIILASHFFYARFGSYCIVSMRTNKDRRSCNIYRSKWLWSKRGCRS